MFDYGQEVLFCQPKAPFSQPLFHFHFSATQEFHVSLNVSGRLTFARHFLTFGSPFCALLRIDIISTWGSKEFVSLDRLQFVDPLGRVIPPSYLRVYSYTPSYGACYRPLIEEVHGLVADSPAASPQEWTQWEPWKTSFWDSSAIRKGSVSLQGKTNSLYVLFDVPVFVALMRVGKKDGCEIGVELS